MNVPPLNSSGWSINPGSHVSAWLLLKASLLLSAVILVAGCQSPAAFPNPNLMAEQAAGPATAVPAQLDARAANYATNQLQEGDIVSINFQYSTNFNAVQKITLDGVLNLDTVGQVKAAGKTVAELQTELTKLYQPQVKGDMVTVKVISSGNSIYVSGAVIRPGKISMDRPMTALEAIMEAGGFDLNRAKLSQVIVVRLEDGKQKTFRLNLKQALNGADETPFYLKPFDIVHVPTKTFNF
jgi:polysaccharide export outer membrane protein